MAPSPRIAGQVLSGLFLGWGAYAVICWSRYGRDRAATQDREDPLDASIPDPEIDERHETRVRAPAAAAMKTLRELDVNRSPLVWLIFNRAPCPRASAAGGAVGVQGIGRSDCSRSAGAPRNERRNFESRNGAGAAAR